MIRIHIAANMLLSIIAFEILNKSKLPTFGNTEKQNSAKSNIRAITQHKIILLGRQAEYCVIPHIAKS